MKIKEFLEQNYSELYINKAKFSKKAKVSILTIAKVEKGEKVTKRIAQMISDATGGVVPAESMMEIAPKKRAF